MSREGELSLGDVHRDSTATQFNISRWSWKKCGEFLALQMTNRETVEEVLVLRCDLCANTTILHALITPVEGTEGRRGRLEGRME